MSEATASSSTLPATASAAAAAAVQAAITKSKTPTVADDKSNENEAASDEPPKETLSAGLVEPNLNSTVFHDTTNFNVKHPLYSPWTLWFDSASKQDKAKSWDEALVKVIGFESVEDFWGLYNNIVPPSLIHPQSNYYLFKEGIKPAWEDKANSKGGKWSVQLPRGKFSDSIDNFWLYTMLAAIGETFETPYVASAEPDSSAAPSPLPPAFSDEVTGVIVSARKAFYRINIWTRTASPENRQRIENIGKHFKYGVLGLDEGLVIKERDKVSTDCEFVSHKDSQAKYGTKVDKWTV